MHTDAQAPHKIFNLPQQFVVPLFQRRYRWNEERQWDPLWKDIQRVTDRLLGASREKVNPHFLGAVVLQNVENPTGSLHEKTIIDGQQRFITLQLLMDAVHGELIKVGAKQAAARLSTLIENGEQFREVDEEQFKIRPTHEDRPQFDAVMASEQPIEYQKLKKSLTPPDTKGTPEFRMIDAHEFFAAKCREWLLADGIENAQKRAETLDRTLREYLEIVVIDLSVDENSQEIFETLNSRGVELTAADLIKNFVFQRIRLDHSETKIESLYNEYWRDFDRLAFWDEEESLGRITQKRSSAFLGYWLTSQTGEETVLSEVFYRFKNRVIYDLDIPILELLARIKKSSAIYNKLVDASMRKEGDLTRPELFMYRIKALDSNLAKAIVLTLLDDEHRFSNEQVDGVLDIVESWIVRRAILQKSTKRYNYVFADVVRTIRTSSPDTVIGAVQKYLSDHTAETSYWPDNDEVKAELRTRNMYHRRPRGRMILEAIEDHYRGWGNSGTSKSQTPRSMRMMYSVEHIIPQQWENNWVLPQDVTPQERNKRVHLLGNLTLVTKSLNSSLSNEKWDSKKKSLSDRDIGFMNKKIISAHPEGWNDVDVENRLDELGAVIMDLWPVPADHKVNVGASKSAKTKREVWLPHLLEAGYIKVGQILFPKRGRYAGRNAIVLEDGSIELEGKLFDSPSGAGRHLTGRETAGWHFWLVNPDSKQMLWDIRQQYIEALSTDIEIEDDEEDEEEVGTDD
jgi:uncharacterized protein with ParB-like and HNH nuclease domain